MAIRLFVERGKIQFTGYIISIILLIIKVGHLELGPSGQIMHEFKLGIFNWVPVGISNLRREAIWSSQF